MLGGLVAQCLQHPPLMWLLREKKMQLRTKGASIGRHNSISLLFFPHIHCVHVPGFNRLTTSL